MCHSSSRTLPHLCQSVLNRGFIPVIRTASCVTDYLFSTYSSRIALLLCVSPVSSVKMQPNQWQQQYPYNGGFQPRQTGFQPGGPGGSLMSSQPTGFQQPMQTGFNQQRPPLNLSSAPTGMGGNMSFLNQPPQQSNFRPSGMTSQMTGYPGGGASGLMSQQTGFQGAMMSQPTGMGMAMGGGGLMSQPTGMGGLRPRPTGIHDPRLQSMMQSFMPSNLSQVCSSSHVAKHS